jgi:hypothetical protein
MNDAGIPCYTDFVADRRRRLLPPPHPQLAKTEGGVAIAKIVMPPP